MASVEVADPHNEVLSNEALSNEALSNEALSNEALSSDTLSDLLLSRGRLPQSCRGDPALHRCLSELTGLGLSQLRCEPRRLQQRHSELVQEAQETAARNYSVFIQSAEATKAMSAELAKVESTVECLLSDRLPRLSNRSSAFAEAVGELASRRKRVQLGLQRHAQVLEVLEIPQLLDTCARNDYWEEALELVGYARRLERGRGLIEAPVVSGVLAEVRAVSEQMLGQVVQRLRAGRVQLPECLRLLGYLRRLADLPEQQLRLHFLSARDAFLAAQLSAVPHDDPHQHARQTAEETRALVFDTVTHYRAAFADQDPLLAAEDGPASESSLLHSWLAHRVAVFLDTMEGDLSRGAGAQGRLESLQSWCMYFGASLAKIGADFRPHLLDLFARAALTQLRVAMDTALKHFSSAVYSYALTLPSSGQPSALWDSQDEIAAPGQLLLHPPLAVLANGVLTGLNELRACMSVNLMLPTAETVTLAARRAADILRNWYSAETGALTQEERDAFGSCCTAFRWHLLPHFNKCLAALCNRDIAARYLGLSATQRASQLENFCCIDADDVCQPLKEFIADDGADCETVADDEANDGEASDTVQKEAAADDVTKVEASDDVTKVEASDDVTKVEADDDVTKTEASDDVTKTEADDDVTKTEASDDVTKTEADDDVTKVEADDDVTKAEADDDVTKTEASDDVTKAEASDDVTSQSADAPDSQNPSADDADGVEGVESTRADRQVTFSLT